MTPGEPLINGLRDCFVNGYKPPTQEQIDEWDRERWCPMRPETYARMVTEQAEADGEHATFYAYLREQFGADPVRALAWYRRWVDEEQPEVNGQSFSMRALAFHCSWALEGKSHAPPVWEHLDYMSTEHGSYLYILGCVGTRQGKEEDRGNS